MARAKGRGIYHSLTLSQSRPEAGPAIIPSAHYTTPLCRVISTKLPRQGVGPALPSTAACKKKGQLSCSHTSGPALLPAVGSKWQRWGRPSLPCQNMVDKLYGQLSHTHTLGACSPVPQLSGSPLLSCPGAEKGPFSQVLQLGRGRASSLALLTSGHLQQVMSSKGEGEYLFLVYATTPETSGQESSSTQGWLTPKLLQCIGPRFQVLLLARGGIMFLFLTPPGPAIP